MIVCLSNFETIQECKGLIVIRTHPVLVRAIL